MSKVSLENGLKAAWKTVSNPEKVAGFLALITAIAMVVMASIIAYGTFSTLPGFYFTAAVLTVGAIVPLVAALHFLDRKSP